MTANERNKHNAEYIRINRKYEVLWFPKVQKAIKAKVSSLINKLKEDGVDAAIRYLHVDLGNYQLRNVIEQMYREVGLRHARRNYILLRSDVAKSNRFNMEVKRFGNSELWADFIANYLKMFLINKITFRVSHTTRDVLLNVLNEAIEKGWGVDEIVKHLEQLPFTANQAARIVRTEINRAANVGVQAQGETFEYELLKIWIAVKDSRTRGNPVNGQHDHADHFHMDGQTVDFDGVFVDSRNGHELVHPGDLKAAAEDQINCRCNMATKAKRDANDRLIPKRQKIAA